MFQFFFLLLFVTYVFIVPVAVCLKHTSYMSILSVWFLACIWLYPKSWSSWMFWQNKFSGMIVEVGHWLGCCFSWILHPKLLWWLVYMTCRRGQNQLSDNLVHVQKKIPWETIMIALEWHKTYKLQPKVKQDVLFLILTVFIHIWLDIAQLLVDSTFCCFRLLSKIFSYGTVLFIDRLKMNTDVLNQPMGQLASPMSNGLQEWLHY